MSKTQYLTNSQKVDLFDLNFEVGYLAKQRELQDRLKLINITMQMANHYKKLNDSQKESEKKEMFAEFLDNVLALGKSNNQNLNYMIHNIDKEDYHKFIINGLESDLKLKDIVIAQKDRIINNMQNES